MRLNVNGTARETLSTPELGAAAFTTVGLGVRSYREGIALFWDKENRKAALADASWAQRWEKRSKAHGKPNQVMGWNAGETGSLLEPPDYQKLAGPWTGDKDPAHQDLALLTPLVDRYQAAGLTDLTVKVYPGGRHEMLNEINRRQVQTRLLGWIFRTLEKLNDDDRRVSIALELQH